MYIGIYAHWTHQLFQLSKPQLLSIKEIKEILKSNRVVLMLAYQLPLTIYKHPKHMNLLINTSHKMKKVDF